MTELTGAAQAAPQPVMAATLARYRTALADAWPELLELDEIGQRRQVMGFYNDHMDSLARGTGYPLRDYALMKAAMRRTR